MVQYQFRDNNGNISNMYLAEATYDPATGKTTVHDNVDSLGEMCNNMRVSNNIIVGQYVQAFPSKTVPNPDVNYFQIRYEQCTPPSTFAPYTTHQYNFGFLDKNGNAMTLHPRGTWAYKLTPFYSDRDAAADAGAFENDLLYITGYGDEPIFGVTERTLGSGGYQTAPYTIDYLPGIKKTEGMVGTTYLTINEFFGAYEPKKQFPGDTSGTGGGGGDFDDTDIPILTPILPQLNATETGFVSIFLPTTEQLRALSSYMWGTSGFWDLLKSIFTSPMDAIISLNIAPQIATVDTTGSVWVGPVDTGIKMGRTSKQFYTWDCGELSIPLYYGTALDYTPNTRFSIYLPFIGTRELNADEIVGKTLHLIYHIDIVSGQCVAFIQVDGSIRYQYTGQCVAQIPVSGANYAQTVNAALQFAGQVGSAVATGGATAMSAVSSGVNLVNSMKPSVSRTGSVSGAAGVMGVLQPYIIRETPRQSLAANYNRFRGYPSNITAKLSTLTGFTKISYVQLDGIGATRDEISEIYQLLNSGVIL